jgi:hypothetical protein
LRVERVFGVHVASQVPLGGDEGLSSESCDIAFELDAARRQGDIAIADRIEIRTPDDVPYLLMGRMAGRFFLRFPGWADFVASPDGRTITGTPAPETPIQTIRHLLLGQVLPRVIGLLRDPALHGSAVSSEGGAVAFLGPSGHGKSTLALSFARSGWALLGDDCLLLRPLDTGVEVIPGQIGARVWPDSADDFLTNTLPGERPSLPTVAHYSDKLRVDDGVGGLALARDPVRLRRLYLLHLEDDPGVPVNVTPLAGLQAFEGLLQQVMRLPPDPERLRREFQFLLRVLSRVDLRVLSYPRAFEHLAAVRAAVEADLGSP